MSLFSSKVNIFYKNVLMKVFPFYYWPFGAYLIFIIVNPLASRTITKGHESDRRLQGPFIGIFILFFTKSEYLKKKISYKSFPFYDRPFRTYLIFISVNPLLSVTKTKGCCLWDPFLGVLPFFPQERILFFLNLIKISHFITDH